MLARHTAQKTIPFCSQSLKTAETRDFFALSTTKNRVKPAEIRRFLRFFGGRTGWFYQNLGQNTTKPPQTILTVKTN